MDKPQQAVGIGQRGGNTSSGSQGGGAMFVLALIALVIFLGFQAVYTVNERERAVVLRFGEFHAVVGPGLQWRLPSSTPLKKSGCDQSP